MTEQTAAILARAAAAAEAILKGDLGPGARIAGVELIKDVTRTVVARARVEGAGAPASVIVKALRDDAATGFSEWASLEFLGGLGAARGVAPRFLGGDAAAGVFLIEDLGPGRTLHELLSAGTAAEAAAALGRLAAQMARLHAATAGHEPALLGLRAALPAAGAIGRRHEASAWLAAAGRVDAWLAAAGCARPAGLDAGLAAVAAAHAEPGAWLCFTHGDPAPSNNHIAGAEVRLLDFEYGAFRHALYDITAWDTLCPLPIASVALMRRVFQAELAAALPIARDGAAFERAWATLCAYRGLAMLTWVSPAVLEADRPMVGDWSARQAVLAAAARTAAATRADPALGPVQAAAESLSATLAARWPELGPPEALATRWAALG